jgi:hypothetical protein
VRQENFDLIRLVLGSRSSTKLLPQLAQGRQAAGYDVALHFKDAYAEPRRTIESEALEHDENSASSINTLPLDAARRVP